MKWRRFLEPNLNRDVDSYVKVTSSNWSTVLKINDCNRSIALDFPHPKSLDDPKHKASILKKLTTLEEALVRVRKELEKHYGTDH